ncbi:CLUMA_CG000406, isoform A [Clunio marinus]|uniref:CLUMA_CG000406, isoform A n=1 Tax=Clunio marinus TaxID=568069 RepID=A0A1J1HIT0_9DIPT|nr:CLUMA_CG000406, isoform A [Clunio marinus]
MFNSAVLIPLILPLNLSNDYSFTITTELLNNSIKTFSSLIGSNFKLKIDCFDKPQKKRNLPNDYIVYT